MNYERGKDKELDDATDALREYLPGFYPGCTIELTDKLPRWQIKHIGKQFRAATFANDISRVADRFKLVGGWAYFIDPNNTYGINYEKHHLKVVDPMYWEKNPADMTMEELEAEMATYYPGFYIGCTMKIMSITPPFLETRIGKTFSTKDICRGRLLNCVISIKKGSVFILDPNNTYCLNYHKENLEVLNPKSTEQPPEKEEVLVFGKYKIGQVVVSLVKVRISREKNELFKVLPKSHRNALFYSSMYSTLQDEWRAATKEEAEYYEKMIHVNSRVLLSREEVIDTNPDTISFDVSTNQIANPVKKQQKLQLISDFTTKQLKSRIKRQKLSIN